MLTDPEKRRIYDRYGIKGLQDGADGLADNFFAQWFPFMGGHRHGGRAAHRGTSIRPIVVQIEVTLEELYNGNVEKTVEYKRNAICTDCDGVGGPPDAKRKCDRCGGRGHFINYSFMDYGFEMVLNLKSLLTTTLLKMQFPCAFYCRPAMCAWDRAAPLLRRIVAQAAVAAL